MTDTAVDASPVVSVVIPTRNAAAHLEQCLESVRAYASEAEVIVVDQSSTDGTRDVAERWGAVLVEVDPPSADRLGAASSRNVGAARARGTYLVHLDADMSLVRPWLDEAIELCERGHVAVVLEESDVASGYWGECKALERRSYRDSPLEAARFVPASLFRDVGGADETLWTGEDWDIHARYAKHGSFGRVPRALYHRVGAMSYRHQLRKKFDYGRSTPAFARKNDTAPLARAMLAAYARSWRSFLADPAHTVGFVVLRASEAAALTTGVLSELALGGRRASSR